MNNLLSYCGLVDARISASEKDLPVHVDNIRLKNILECWQMKMQRKKSKQLHTYCYQVHTLPTYMQKKRW